MQVQVKHGSLVGVCDAESVHDVFKQIAQFQETFEDSKCGLCNSENLKYVVREVEGTDFYEIHCKNCNGKLTFGTSQKTKTLYPRRYEIVKDGKNKGKALKDEDGNAIKLGKNKNGWVTFNPKTGKEE